MKNIRIHLVALLLLAVGFAGCKRDYGVQLAPLCAIAARSCAVVLLSSGPSVSRV